MRRNQWIQAYKNAPWRKQLQFIGVFSGTVIFIAIVAGVYLNVTARAATLGREIQDLQEKKEILQRDIEDMRTSLAYLTTNEEMERRAIEAGFVLIEPGTPEYYQYEDYGGKETAQLAPEGQQTLPSVFLLPREYTISLFEWIQETIYLIGIQTGAQSGGNVP